MEHKIGEIITLPDGRKAEVVAVKERCNGCTFRTDTERQCWNAKLVSLIGECFNALRSDHKNIIYKEIKD